MGTFENSTFKHCQSDAHGEAVWQLKLEMGKLVSESHDSHGFNWLVWTESSPTKFSSLKTRADNLYSSLSLAF